MTDSDDLFELYRNDRSRGAGLTGDALAAVLVKAVRTTFTAIEALAAEVERALAKARYTLKVASAITDRGSYVRIDRAGEGLADYLRGWASQRTENGGTMHWEAAIVVTDSRRQTAEIGLGVAIDWPSAPPGAAFVEFWTTGQGVSLPADPRGFQRALVAALVKLEEMGLLTPATR
jgi:hypothetical protein